MERTRGEVPVTHFRGGKITVFLSDQQVLFREGIHFILSGEEDFEVIGEAGGNQEALKFIEANPPRVAVLNFQDSVLGGPELTRRIKRNSPSCSVVLTMDSKDEEEIFASAKAGASACVTKDVSPEDLLDLISSVGRGEDPIVEEMFVPGVASMALNEFVDMAEIAGQLDIQLAALTPREKEVLEGVASGKAREELASGLELPLDAIKNNLKMALGKLVANDRDLALLEVVQRNLPAMIGGIGKAGAPSDYLTRAEFNSFKKSLTKRLKELAG
jgi:DNA-binding NarL/FixJ family response regulator